MKKLLLASFILLLLVGCSTKEEPITTSPAVVSEKAGGWTINTDLPEMDDAIFDMARQKLTDVSYSPLFVLGTQVVSGTNYQYLCYAKTKDPNATRSFKIVTVYKEPGRKLDGTIINVADFEITDFTNEQGKTTPEDMAGGFKEIEEFPNFLSEEENTIFEKAFEGFAGVGYKPIAKLASQVVAGTNYAFLATGTTITAEPKTHLYVINIFNDLKGNATINNICGLDLTKFTGNN